MPLMPRLITLSEDGPLGLSGAQVWVNDDEKSEPKKTQAKKSKHDED